MRKITSEYLGKGFGHIDDVKKELCKKIRHLADGDPDCKNRICSALEELEVSFLEELEKKVLEFILQMESAIIGGTIKEIKISTNEGWSGSIH